MVANDTFIKSSSRGSEYIGLRENIHFLQYCLFLTFSVFFFTIIIILLLLLVYISLLPLLKLILSSFFYYYLLSFISLVSLLTV